MAVKIGHASIDERGRVNSGQAGDQTGKEVCTRSWYNKGWTVLLRAKDSAVAERMAKACEAGCANPRIGYDQYQRNTLRTKAKAVGWDLSKITTNCETDCSAFMTVCAEAAGIDMDGTYTSGNAPVTWSMRQLFVGTGAFTALTDSKYLTSDKYLRRGDILVYEKGHTVMALSDGELSGGGPSPVQPSSSDPTIAEWQNAAIADGFTFPKYGADGEWGAECEAVAKKAIVKQRSIYLYKNLTKIVQRAVGVTVDGLCGSKTVAAIKEYQKQHGLYADGQVGINTWKKILGV